MALSVPAPHLSLTQKWAVPTLRTIELVTAHQHLLSWSVKDHGMWSTKIFAFPLLNGSEEQCRCFFPSSLTAVRHHYCWLCHQCMQNTLILSPDCQLELWQSVYRTICPNTVAHYGSLGCDEAECHYQMARGWPQGCRLRFDRVSFPCTYCHQESTNNPLPTALWQDDAAMTLEICDANLKYTSAISTKEAFNCPWKSTGFHPPGYGYIHINTF